MDKAIGYINPRASLRRLRARLVANELLRYYEGAQRGRRMDGWITSGGSANAAIDKDLLKLRDRSRDLCRNNYLAAKAAHEFRTKIVGTGIPPRTSNAAMEAWMEFSAHCSADGLPSFEALQMLVAGTVWESGECLVRFRHRPLSDGLRIPLQLQVLEPDYLDFSKTGKTSTGYTIHGVEFDRIGRVTGYWLFSQHPGDNVLSGSGAFASKFVEARYVLHIRNISRPGQVRGVPALAPAITILRNLDDWEDAELVRKRTEACLAAFITTPDVDTIAAGTLSTDPKTGVTLEEFRPGMVTRLKPGESVTTNTPQYAGGYAEYKRSRARDVACALGMPYEILTGDLSQVNYSSYRAGLLSFRDAIEAFQYNIMIPMLCRPVWEEFSRVAWTAGAIREMESAAWDPPAFDLLDRESEAKADQIELQIGTKTWPQAVARQGYDPERQLEEIEKWRPRLQGAGVSFQKAKEGNGTASN